MTLPFRLSPRCPQKHNTCRAHTGGSATLAVAVSIVRRKIGTNGRRLRYPSAPPRRKRCSYSRQRYSESPRPPNVKTENNYKNSITLRQTWWNISVQFGRRLRTTGSTRFVALLAPYLWFRKSSRGRRPLSAQTAPPLPSAPSTCSSPVPDAARERPSDSVPECVLPRPIAILAAEDCGEFPELSVPLLPPLRLHPLLLLLVMSSSFVVDPFSPADAGKGCWFDEDVELVGFAKNNERCLSSFR